MRVVLISWDWKWHIESEQLMAAVEKVSGGTGKGCFTMEVSDTHSDQEYMVISSEKLSADQAQTVYDHVEDHWEDEEDGDDLHWTDAYLEEKLFELNLADLTDKIKAEAKAGTTATVSSVKIERNAEEADRLRSLGYKVCRDRDRYKVTVPISDVEAISAIWSESFFHLPDGVDGRPSIISVQFHGVSCRSINGYRWGELQAVLMVDPIDPVHSPIFAFRVDMTNNPSNLDFGEVAVTLERDQRSKLYNLRMFMRVLRICARELYTPGKKVNFNVRKFLGRAKQKHFKRQTLGEPDPNWDRIVALEKSLQSNLPSK